MPALGNKAHFAQPGHPALVVCWMAGLDPLKRTPGLDVRRVGKASSHQQLARWAHLGQQGPLWGPSGVVELGSARCGLRPGCLSATGPARHIHTAGSRGTKEPTRRAEGRQD